MQFFKKAALAASLALATTSAANAGIVAEANGARAQGRWGGEFGLGYRISAAGFSLTPAVGAFVFKGDNDRYYRDTFSNGQSRCRDSTNGRFADNSKCRNVDVKPYGRIEASYSIPLVAEIGAGARFSQDKVRPYGLVAFPFTPLASIRANAGPKYFALGLRAGF